VKPCRLVVAARARVAIRRVDAWWKLNRGAAPRLFEEELAAAFELIANTPRAGKEWPSMRLPAVRRWLLSKTQYHVYYTLDDDEAVAIVRMVWYAGRGRGPRL
jgi:plasmid stabilization system protein ParE